MRTALVILALLGAACTPEEGPLMAANQDCLACHGRGDAKAWTVAGTFGGKGSRITITDRNGWSFTLHAAENGNFYTAEKVVFPLTVTVDGKPMADDTTGEVIPLKYGGCNVCHGPGGLVVTGELMAPGTDCLICHDGSVAEKRFTVAGTWRGPGRTIIVTGPSGSVRMTTNAVGNFYTSDPVGFPAAVSVEAGTETQRMEPPLEYGGCNRCHGNGGEAEGD